MMRSMVLVVVGVGLCLGGGPPSHASKAPVAAEASKAASVTGFTREVWGRTYFGDGYVYGDAFGSPPVAVVDLDSDGDDDVVFRSDYSSPFKWLRNLGTSDAFYPGGIRDLAIPAPPGGAELDLSADFKDLNGDAKPDLVVVVVNFDTAMKGVAWYRNSGTTATPAFTYMGLLYTTSQSTYPGMWVNAADIDSDGLLDVFFAEAFLQAPGNHHRVFWMHNTGSAQTPQWAGAQEIAALSNLMPPRIALSKQGVASERTRYVSQRSGDAKAAYGYRLGDIELADWNADGALDFMFYDKQEGVHWVANTGTAETPAWAGAVASQGNPVYDHRDDDLTFAEGSFALRSNADLRSRREWIDDFYVSVDGRFMTWRYFTRDNRYFLTNRSTLAYPMGQGPAALWDCDEDGDLDLFRTGVATGALLCFPNIGTPYAPAWGEYIVVNDVMLDRGTLTNYYRQDLYNFADLNGDGHKEFLVQGQDGRVQVYAATPGMPPHFTLAQADLGSPMPEDLDYVDPRGVAAADFGQDAQGRDGVIVAYEAFSGGQSAAKLIFFHPATGINADLSTLITNTSFTGIGLGTYGPGLIEGLAAIELNGDGRPDLAVSLSTDEDYELCSQHVFLNVGGSPPGFTYAGRIEAPYASDPYYARMPGAVDIDADGDDDLFVAHQTCLGDDCGRNFYLAFYRNGLDTGFDYWRTRAVSGQSWTLWWNGVRPTYSALQLPSGGSIANPGGYTAGPASNVVDILESTNLARDVRVFVDVLPEVAAGESKAVLVLGSDPADPLYPTFREVTAFAYWVLRMEGLPAESIRLYAPTALDADEDGANDVYAAPTAAALQPSITTWAKGSQRFLVYLVDHGQRNLFKLNAAEYLASTDYAAWIDALQAGGGPLVTTLIDTCEAGTWADDLAIGKTAEKAGAQRITIAGSGAGPIEGVALFDQVRNISFSQSFWSAVFNGSTYGEAFRTAKVALQAVNPLQAPQIDDDGDGIPNEGNDGFLAQATRPGADFELSIPGVYIGDVAENAAVSRNSATLWIGDVVAPLPVEEAGALIVPPNFQRPTLSGDDEQPVTGLDWLDLTPGSSGRWSASYSGFTEGGLYRVLYYVKSGGRYHASPRIGYVDRIGIADAWEQDDTFLGANWLPVNSVQGHNFHDKGDADWLRFMAPSGLSGTIAVLAPAPNCQPKVQLYRAGDLEKNAKASPIREAISRGAGKPVEFTETFAASGPFALRITNNDANAYGAGTSYLVLVAVGTGEVLPTALIVSVQDIDTNKPVAGATVEFNNGAVISETTGDGVTNFVCPSYGAYAVKVSKSGYQSATQEVQVNNINELAQILLKSDGTTPPSGGCGGTAPMGYGDWAAMAVAAAILTRRKPRLSRR